MKRSVWNLFTFSAAVVGVMMACGMGRDHATVDAGTADSARPTEDANAMVDGGTMATPDLLRVRTAETDVTQLDSGRSPSGSRVKVLDGPFVLTEVINQSGFSGNIGGSEVFVSSAAGCSDTAFTVTKLAAGAAFNGRIFVKPGNFLCVQATDGISTNVMWSGFRPYATP